MRYELTGFNRIVTNKSHHVKLGLHGAICLTDSVVFTLGHCVDFKATRYELTGFNRIVVDGSYYRTLALSMRSIVLKIESLNSYLSYVSLFAVVFMFHLTLRRKR